MPALTPEQQATVNAMRDAAEEALGDLRTVKLMEKYISVCTPEAILAILAQLEAAQEAPRVRSPYMLGVNPSDWNAQLAALQQPVQAVADGAILVRPNEAALGRGEYPISVMRAAQNLMECMSAAAPGGPGQ